MNGMFRSEQGKWLVLASVASSAVWFHLSQGGQHDTCDPAQCCLVKDCHGSLTEFTEYDIFFFCWRTSVVAWTRYAQEDMQDLLWANEAERDPTQWTRSVCIMSLG